MFAFAIPPIYVKPIGTLRMELAWKHIYFPTQKFLKMFPNTSLGVI